MSASDFRELDVWKKSRELAVEIYRLTEMGHLARDFGLRGQMKRAAVSVCSNIAEGNDRNSNKEMVRFLFIAKGSCAELIAQEEIARGVGFLDPQEALRLTENC